MELSTNEAIEILNKIDWNKTNQGLAINMAVKALKAKNEIISRIEQARDLDKNVGEYPYNRCIEIIKDAMK